MTNIFIESGSERTNEYRFIEAILADLHIDKKAYKITTVGGKDNLKNISVAFKECDKNIIVFDADRKENKGGFSLRKNELTKILNSMKVQAELFLFPNNKDDGMFETLLEQIINPKHKRILKCFTGYENCMEQYKDTDGNLIYQTPDQKAKMYAYISAFKNSETEAMKNRGDWHFENKEYWNLDSPALTPLKDFLRTTIG